VLTAQRKRTFIYIRLGIYFNLQKTGSWESPTEVRDPVEYVLDRTTPDKPSNEDGGLGRAEVGVVDGLERPGSWVTECDRDGALCGIVQQCSFARRKSINQEPDFCVLSKKANFFPNCELFAFFPLANCVLFSLLLLLSQ
jgi:hypothetical protein